VQTHEPPTSETVGRRQGSLVIAVVVPFLNEAWCLPTFLESIAGQERLPDRLVLVDDGSTDGSAEIADEFARARPEVTVLRRAPRAPARDRLAQAHELRAFQSAVKQLDCRWDVVAKLDADLELSPKTIARVEQAFLADRELGMAGVRLCEAGADGDRVRMVSRPEHVEGATKFYRRACWDDIAPIAPILGWDSFDEVHARSRGWRTQSFSAPDGDTLHMRRMGTQGAILGSFRRWGTCSYGSGMHPLHVLFYGQRLMRRRRPYVVGGLNYVGGWALAGLRRAPRAEPEIRRAVRQEELTRAKAKLLVRGGRERKNRAKM
jgi:biofilm PGA synthesis N-glycosyltransferase PgaC